MGTPTMTSSSLHLHVLPQIVSSHVRRIDAAVGVRSDARRSRPIVERVGIRRIWNEGLERSVFRASDDNASYFSLSRCRIRRRRADINRVVPPDEHRTRFAELRPGGDEAAVL